MTDKKTKNSPPAKTTAPAGECADRAEHKSNSTRSAQENPAGKKLPDPASRAGKGSGYWWWLVFFLLLIALIAFAWFSWPQLRIHISGHQHLPPANQAGPTQSAANTRQPADATRAPAAPIEQPPQAEPGGGPEPDGAQSPSPSSQPAAPTPDQQASQPQQADADLSSQIESQARTIEELQQQLAGLQRSITAQGNRLSELGNVTRKDWQLAEASYLLRMANQRLILEDDSRAALGLVEEVDSILREVDLPDLYGVRQQLAQDITALKLVQDVDREGLFLRLRALEGALIRARIQPEFDMTHPQPEGQEEEPQPEGVTQPPWQRGWQKFIRFLRDSVRPIDGDINPVMLSPQSEVRFRQTLRLDMEQAQLALLRGDTTVYKDALNSARELLLTYGTPNPHRDALAQQLAELSEERIQAQMPNLNASQVALNNYIEQLHTTSDQSDNTQGEGTQ
ncbi:uroporphyrinogen-III C-methyltransferase [Microbulbifer sp. 2205BS26-8]|uniref:uroporphyrinogen-III C-methyltransferase n=1 Tax=Microbulbifer sp. 2205BS26-8 TaxID=3064386 RepID=UPI00273FA59D|nr:uroporphyrinogen-III C-methyltransferase [Microbulbifer sp. 2205BS26-8]MDP5208132.1 uroporphyrinogen-III C-methyltransferase [Microbulbifer sp. 2205BS26-8]